MFYFLCMLSLFNFLFSESSLSDRYTTLTELDEKINQWNLEFGDNADPYPFVNNEGIIFHHEIIGYTGVDNLPIWAIKLSFNADIDEDEPKVLILGQCHAEEIYGVEIAVELIEWMLNPNDSGNSQYAQAIYAIMSQSEIWIVPTHNPEGLGVVHGWYDEFGEWNQDESYRKNKYDANQNGFFDYVYGIGDDIDGVDLNRNYDFNWIFGDDFQQTDTGCSANPSYLSNYDYYRGPFPFSEPEIRAIKDFALEKNFLLSIAYHSSRSGCVSEKVIYPWLWEDTDKGASPDLPIISRLGDEIASKIPTWDGLGFYYSANSISRRGNAHDWLYSQTGCIQYLIEVGTEDMQSDDVDLIDNTVFNNMQGLMHLLKRAAGTNIQNGPDAYQITGLVSNIYGDPINAKVRILELDGPMLKPRYTDSFGRFRRLLIEGTYTLEVSADGYETHTYQFVPSSSNVTEHNVTLNKYPEHNVEFDFTFPDNFSDFVLITLSNEFKVDTLYVSLMDIIDEANELINPYNFDEISEIHLDPLLISEGEYKLKLLSYNTFPEIIDLNIQSDTSIFVDAKWKGVIMDEDFDDLSKWDNQGSWVIVEDDIPIVNLCDHYLDVPYQNLEESYYFDCVSNSLLDNDTTWHSLSSQSSLFYADNNQSIIKTLDSYSDSYNSSNKYALGISMWHELEWEEDFTSFYFTCNGCVNDTLIDVSGQSLVVGLRDKYHYAITSTPYFQSVPRVNPLLGYDYVPFELHTAPSKLNISFSSDESLYYRGSKLYGLQMLFKPDGECHKGDLNLDGEINVADIVIIINVIFEVLEVENYIGCVADMNDNNQININDIVIMVEAIVYN